MEQDLSVMLPDKPSDLASAESHAVHLKLTSIVLNEALLTMCVLAMRRNVIVSQGCLQKHMACGQALCLPAT